MPQLCTKLTEQINLIKYSLVSFAATDLKLSFNKLKFEPVLNYGTVGNRIAKNSCWCMAVRKRLRKLLFKLKLLRPWFFAIYYFWI